VIADLRGKGGRVRTVAVPVWVKQAINAWTTAAGIEGGRLLRPVLKSGKVVSESLSDWAIWSVVKQSASAFREDGVPGFYSFHSEDQYLRTCCPMRRHGH
jgi:hypothetical protein